MNKKTENSQKNGAKRITYIALCTALALIIGYVESRIPVLIAVPGVKLGLSNIMVLIMFYISGAGDALILAVLKVGLSTLLFGNFSTLIYSASGAALAYLFMFVCFRFFRWEAISTSLLGALGHNLGQITAAAILMENIRIYYYLVVLLFAAAITGFLSGVLAQLLLRQLKKNRLI